MPTFRCSLALCIVLLLAQQVPAEDADQPVTQAASDAALERWIGDLASSDYHAREMATEQLISAGSSAVGPISQAARTDDLEVAHRSIQILQSLLECDDPATRLLVEKTLDELATQAHKSTASLATDALAFYHLTKQDRVIDELRQLRAIVNNEMIDFGEGASIHVQLTSEWQGANDNLALLKQLPSLRRLSIRNVRLDAAAQKTLAGLKQVQEMELFGTGITAEAADNLAKSTGAKIDRRNGALLGVGGQPGLNGCVITQVQEGTAAHAAGLFRDDEIVSFDGHPVQKFEELTALIAEKAAGQTAVLQIRRAGRLIEKQITLGRWD